MKTVAPESPWLTLDEAAAYARRGRRFIARQAHAGLLRAAIVTGRRQMLFRSEWIDSWLESMVTPAPLSVRRRVS